MVLQRDKPIPIWGLAKPNTEVSVLVTDVKNPVSGAVLSSKVKSDAKGNWKTIIGPFAAGGPFTITVSGFKEGRDTGVSYPITNVMAGDVWICSGQSNMKMTLQECEGGADAAAKASPQIRLMTVPEIAAMEPRDTVETPWNVCTPESAKGFSGVGFYFGQQLQSATNVPIGLINSSWGGTRIQAWMSLDTLRPIPESGADVERFDAMLKGIKSGKTVDQFIEEWWQKNDEGSAPGAKSWAAPDLETGDWKTEGGIPKRLDQTPAASFRGVVWFRKDITIPQDWAGKELKLSLSRIVAADTTYFNGVAVGSGDSVWVDRINTVPANLVKPGKATIAIRIYCEGGDSAFRPDLSKNFKIEVVGAPEKSIPLEGDWLFKMNTKRSDDAIPRRPDNNTVSANFNGMIAPLLRLPFKGVIWYQGEWNASEGRLYNTLLPTMMYDWRKRAGIGDFPFYIVQLASLENTQPGTASEKSGWAEVREAQWRTALRMPASGLATAVDTHGLHPLNKAVVGERLARIALSQVYGKKAVHLGPSYASMKKTPEGIEVKFENVNGGLVSKGDIKAFALAGADQKFVWAKATIKSADTILVSSAEVKSPEIVRYGWSDSPECTLFDKADLPALPFRSDIPGDLPNSPYYKPSGSVPSKK